MSILKEKEFYLKGTGLTITQKCTLNCKLCCTFTPYYSNPMEFSFEVLDKSMKKYFEIVDRVGKFTLSGGEPFSHSNLNRIIIAAKKYKNQIGLFEVITNGTIVPNNTVIEAIKGYGSNIRIMIDHYGDYSSKVEELKHLFDSEQIEYMVRLYHGEDMHCNGWVDFGDFKKIHFTEDEIISKFKKCAYPAKLGFCFSTVNGKIYPCMPARRCVELGLIEENDEKHIDLFDETISVEEQRKKILDIINCTYLNSCAYCNGLCEDSIRFKPAEQLG